MSKESECPHPDHVRADMDPTYACTKCYMLIRIEEHEALTKPKELLDLKQYNSDRWTGKTEEMKSPGNGIACPDCGTELYDASPGGVLITNPGQLYVQCPNYDDCGFRGTRVL